jgi:Uma2 family endonuclease
MIAQSDRTYLTPEQYLEAERHATIKHEYIDGEVYAMAGASSSHGLIVTNLIAILRPRLRGSNCRLFSSDMKVNLESRNCFYYPDVLVTCDDRDRATDYYKNHPKLIVEVLSDSTEAFDRGDKFSDYSDIETLEEYILVSQQHKRVDRFYRNSHKQWVFTQHNLGETLRFDSLDFECAVAEVYEDVEISN